MSRRSVFNLPVTGRVDPRECPILPLPPIASLPTSLHLLLVRPHAGISFRVLVQRYITDQEVLDSPEAQG